MVRGWCWVWLVSRPVPGEAMAWSSGVVCCLYEAVDPGSMVHAVGC